MEKNEDEKQVMENLQEIVSELSDLALNRLLVCASLEEKRRTWKMLYERHPSRYVRCDAWAISMFLHTLELWYTPKGTIFHNEYVKDYVLDILQGIDGVRIYPQCGYAIAELDVSATMAFCDALPNMLSATGRTWREEIKEVENVRAGANKSPEVG